MAKPTKKDYRKMVTDLFNPKDSDQTDIDPNSVQQPEERSSSAPTPLDPKPTQPDADTSKTTVESKSVEHNIADSVEAKPKFVQQIKSESTKVNAKPAQQNGPKISSEESKPVSRNKLPVPPVVPGNIKDSDEDDYLDLLFSNLDAPETDPDLVKFLSNLPKEPSTEAEGADFPQIPQILPNSETEFSAPMAELTSPEEDASAPEKPAQNNKPGDSFFPAELLSAAAAERKTQPFERPSWLDELDEAASESNASMLKHLKSDEANEDNNQSYVRPIGKVTQSLLDRFKEEAESEPEEKVVPEITPAPEDQEDVTAALRLLAEISADFEDDTVVGAQEENMQSADNQSVADLPIAEIPANFDLFAGGLDPTLGIPEVEDKTPDQEIPVMESLGQNTGAPISPTIQPETDLPVFEFSDEIESGGIPLFELPSFEDTFNSDEEPDGLRLPEFLEKDEIPSLPDFSGITNEIPSLEDVIGSDMQIPSFFDESDTATTISSSVQNEDNGLNIPVPSNEIEWDSLGEGEESNLLDELFLPEAPELPESRPVESLYDLSDFFDIDQTGQGGAYLPEKQEDMISSTPEEDYIDDAERIAEIPYLMGGIPNEKDDYLGKIIQEIEAETESNNLPGDDYNLGIKPAHAALNVQQYIVFSIQSTDYAVPIKNISEVTRPLKITYVPNVPDWVAGVVNMRGDIISVVDLRVYIGQVGDELQPSNRMMVVHSEKGDIVMGLIVDRVGGIRDMPEEQIRSPSAPITDRITSFLRGVIDLDDRMVIVLDLDHFLLSPEMLQFQ